MQDTTDDIISTFRIFRGVTTKFIPFAQIFTAPSDSLFFDRFTMALLFVLKLCDLNFLSVFCTDSDPPENILSTTMDAERIHPRIK